jgi:hypothetical protein
MPLDENDTARLAELRRAAYSREGSPADLTELRELEQRAAEPEPPEPAAFVEPEPAAADNDVHTVPPVPPRRRLPRVLAIAAATIVVAGIGFGIGRIPTDAAPAASGRTQGVAPLSLLDTAQTQADVPAVALDGDITADSVHLLASVQSHGVSVYGARTTAGLVCLVAVTTGLETAQSCVSRADFVGDGIRLRITTNQLVQNDRVPNSQAYWEYYWQGDGHISAESNLSPFASAP